MNIFKTKIPELPPWKVGLLQSIGLFTYIIGISLLMNKMSQIFATKSTDQILTGVVMISIFAVSALVCAVISGTIPVYLFFNKQMKTAVTVVLWNVVTMIALVLITVIIMILTANSRQVMWPMQ